MCYDENLLVNFVYGLSQVDWSYYERMPLRTCFLFFSRRKVDLKGRFIYLFI